MDETAALFERWMAAGKLARVDARHLIFSIWATTQHYADFDAQVQMLMDGQTVHDGADTYLETLYRRLLTI